MDPICETVLLSKRYGGTRALREVTLMLPEGTLVGLIGTNGSGKTTLIRHFLGLVLPTMGTCRTLGVDSANLGPVELSQIGAVHQEGQLLGWMTVRQHLRYVASFYARWDGALERRLVEELELDPDARVQDLSIGKHQALSILLAVCHRPRLLLLDEPVSALDPLVRKEVLRLLVDLLREDGSTIVISSHVLRDIESIVDRVACLHQGRLKVHAPLDDLRENYTEWRVQHPEGHLPEHFAEPYILDQQISGRQARLIVRATNGSLQRFQEEHGVTLEAHPLNLEEMFPYLLQETTP